MTSSLPKSFAVIYVLGMILSLSTACKSPSTSDSLADSQITVSVVEQLRSAYLETDPLYRRQSVINATESFLEEPTARTQSDSLLSTVYSEIAFSTGSIAVPEPAKIIRQGELALVVLPDNMGMYLYDFSSHDSSPLVLTDWTLGVRAVEPYWQDETIGVLYTTVNQNDDSQHHFLLLEEKTTGWDIVWHSDDNPDWWFNSQNARVQITPDLSVIVVQGTASLETPIFDETQGIAKQQFRIQWLLNEDNTYTISPPPAGYETREGWLAEVSLPSPYSTLVRFLQDLRSDDIRGAQRFVYDESIISEARAFGLYLFERRYIVVASSEESITFRDNLGTFVVTFEPEFGAETGWLITSIRPIGAVDD